MVQNVLAADLKKEIIKKKSEKKIKTPQQQQNKTKHTLLWLDSNIELNKSAAAQKKDLKYLSRGRCFQS